MPTYHIGKDYPAPIHIDDKHASVSRQHASITIDDDTGVWTLRDLNSTNGTYVEIGGKFRRCDKLEITPDTWIRLGEEGHRGYYFKARRVLKPNDYREDFARLYETYQEWEQTKEKLDYSRKYLKYITIVLMFVGLALSCLPGIADNPLLVRFSFMLPGIISPFIQEAMISKLRERVKTLQTELICPKCRRVLSRDDIINREHLYCQAR